MKQVQTTGNVRLRRGYGLDVPTVTTLRAGTVIDIQPELRIDRDGEAWVAARFGAAVGFVAERYLRPVPDVAPVRNPVGLHVTGGAVPGELLPMIERLAKANRPIAAITVVNHGWLVKEIKRLSPQTFVLFRVVHSDADPSPADQSWPDGEEYFRRHWDKSEGCREADAHQLFGLNEWVMNKGMSLDDLNRFSVFYQQLIIAFANRGLKCTVGDFGVGKIEPEQYDTLRPMFVLAQAKGMYLNYHAYSSKETSEDMELGAEFYAMRWTRIARDYPQLRFIFGESGPYDARFYSVATTIRMMQQHQRQLAPFASQVIGSCWWTLAPDLKWLPSDFLPALPMYEQWLMKS